ncbi:MAG: hypothetical protein CMC93_03860 [Flavobacteriaceae bacterium]|nr:hypothetical protein [Flavobacteriaceae bacterium]|tara:strand:+ start:502 stop:687 length:186 start_codon:yes stop_codon:yes gene_type:complete
MAYGDRSECAKKWLAANYTDINPDMGEKKTQTLEQWMLIKVPVLGKIERSIMGFEKEHTHK